jgi:hypothetical protein
LSCKNERLYIAIDAVSDGQETSFLPNRKRQNP